MLSYGKNRQRLQPLRGGELVWAVFGNPTRTTGRFRECFAGGRFAHRWSPKQIDSRSVGMTNKAQIAAWMKDHGEDSDFVRVRVRGVFPRAGSLQFIDGQRVDEAVVRALTEDPTAAVAMGVDIGRQGPDQSVIRFRRGLDERSIPAVKFRIPDLAAMSWVSISGPRPTAPTPATPRRATPTSAPRCGAS
jgi:hypothetical protein